MVAFLLVFNFPKGWETRWQFVLFQVPKGASGHLCMLRCVLRGKVASGKRLQFAIENGHRNSWFTYEILWTMVIFHNYVSLPKGSPYWICWRMVYPFSCFYLDPSNQPLAPKDLEPLIHRMFFSRASLKEIGDVAANLGCWSPPRYFLDGFQHVTISYADLDHVCRRMCVCV